MDADCIIGDDYFELDGIWKDHLEPNLAAITLPLLAGVTSMLGEIHEALILWNMASEEWDPHSYHRSAIERHEQDRFQEPIDVLIDAARETLERLAETRSAALDGWLATANTSIPLLLRLAVHAITIHKGMSPDERVGWILDQAGLPGNIGHHEVYRAVELN